jgi:hypothetical protein
VAPGLGDDEPRSPLWSSSPEADGDADDEPLARLPPSLASADPPGPDVALSSTDGSTDGLGDGMRDGVEVGRGETVGAVVELAAGVAEPRRRPAS